MTIPWVRALLTTNITPSRGCVLKIVIGVNTRAE